jgi:two-component system, cell cycle sensor histidine kinase and response regulator CckA
MIRVDRQIWKSREVSRVLALFEAERHYYQEIVAGLPNALLVISPELRVVSANQRFFEILNVSSEDVLGRRLGDLLPVPGLAEHIAGVLNSGAPRRNIVIEAPAKDGVQLLVAGISVLKPADGEEAGVLLALEDLSAVGRLETVPKGAEPRYLDLIDDLDAIVWERDAATLQFTYVNRRGEEILGYPAKQWIENPDFWARRVHPEDRDLALAFHRAAAAHGDVHECEYRVLAADDRIVWLREIITPSRDDSGKPARLRGLMLEVSARRFYQEQALQDQKLDALSRLAGRMAHDFNNLLMVITGYAQEIAGELKSGDPLREDAEEILNAADRATAFTKTLLAYARRQVVEIRDVDLNAMLRALESRLRQLLGDSIELEMALDHSLGLIKTDPVQLQKSIVNLVTNARDAIPARGEVRIATGHCTVSGEEGADVPALEPGDYATLTVSDSGRGMDEETRSHLFEPFFTTKDPARSTGLGLALTYGMAKQCGGDIQVESVPGRGSTFRIYLPLVAASAAPASAPAPVAAPVAAPAAEPAVELKTVLLVEDEGGIRALVRKILERNAYSVLEASNAEQALRISAAHRGALDLLVTGMVLPDSTGRELADKLETARPALKTIYVFGYTSKDVALAADLPENASFLQKPFSLDALLRKVKAALTPPPEAQAAGQ